MLYKTLGSSYLNISEIALGCMSLQPGNTTSAKILEHALDAGINYFDTADLYNDGENESMLGQVFAKKRDKVILATKVGNQRRADGEGWIWNPRKSYILDSVEKSLRRLQTDYIDLYQLHGGTIEDPIDEVIEAFEKLRSDGKIRYYGISSIRPNVIREYVKRSSIVSVMTQYSVADRRPMEEVMPLLSENKIGNLARGSVVQGILSGKPVRPYLSYSVEEMDAAKNILLRMTSSDRSATQILLKYVMQNEMVTSPVVGVSSREQLDELIEVTNIPHLTKEEIKQLNTMLPTLYYSEHR